MAARKVLHLHLVNKHAASARCLCVSVHVRQYSTLILGPWHTTPYIAKLA